MERDILNKIYKKLDDKAREICTALHAKYGYFNGHYGKNSQGNYELDFFPIPVITVENLCDIEISLNQISVTTKLEKGRALNFDFTKISSYDFEAYGEKNYLRDFFVMGDTIDKLIENIANCDEQNIMFAFCFPFEVDAGTLQKLVKLLKGNGFFY